MAEKKMGRPVKYDEAFFKQAGDSVMEFAMRDDSLSILGWRGETGYTFNRITEWCDKSEYFSDMYETAKAIIGHRREQGALNGKLNASMVEKRGWQYCSETKAYAREMAQLDSAGKVVIEGRVAPQDPEIKEAKGKE